MQARALVKERLQRNLLLLIDGVKTEEMLLANVTGLKPEDFKFLASLNLIAPVSGSSSGRSSSSASSGEERGSAPTQPMSLPPVDDGAMDYAHFTSTLTQLISSELGLRGFTLTLAVEKASTIEDLRSVADRVLEQIRDRKGEAVAEKARRTLYGG